jgi:hypothetical protein
MSIVRPHPRYVIAQSENTLGEMLFFVAKSTGNETYTGDCLLMKNWEKVKTGREYINIDYHPMSLTLARTKP